MLASPTPFKLLSPVRLPLPLRLPRPLSLVVPLPVIIPLPLGLVLALTVTIPVSSGQSPTIDPDYVVDSTGETFGGSDSPDDKDDLPDAHADADAQ